MSQSPEVSDMWLVGAGIMAQGYAKVLTALDVVPTIGRSRASADGLKQPLANRRTRWT